MRIGWANKGIFKTLRGELQAMSDRVFERGALPYLRMVFPRLVGSPPRRGLDAAGIDYLEFTESQPFPIIVQCKGFEVRELEADQVRQVLGSIRSFRESGFRTDTFLLVHNRLGKHEAFRTAVEEALHKLVETGAAANAELWDVDMLVKRALTGLYQRLTALAREKNLSVVKEYAEAEPELCAPLDEVPLRIDLLTVDQHRLARTAEGQERVADPVRVLLETKSRFALLVGYAGFGKTTATLRLTRESGLRTFFVPAARLERMTTTDILGQCVDIEALVAGHAEEHGPTVRRAARLVIDVFFAKDDGSYLLLLDGLDESTVIAQRGGLQHLFNALRRVGSRIVLTVRKEFLEARATDFSSSVGLVSDRPHRRQNQSLAQVELLPWTDDKIVALVRRFAETVEGEGRDRLLALADQINAGSYRAIYGDIPRRPLFLRFIMETVADTGVHAVDRASLFMEWARLKIVRDVTRPTQFGGQRVPITDERSLDDTIDLAFEAMSWAARCMTRVSDGQVQMLPTCSVTEVLALPALNGRGNVEGLLLNSLLVPVGSRRPPEPLQLRFAHRAYQEYFLARFICREPNTFAVALPPDVEDWLDGLRRSAQT
jgi:hypothetical protein